MSELKKIYFAGADGKTRSAHIPIEAVAFGIGASCPGGCKGKVVMIDYGSHQYRCDGGPHLQVMPPMTVGIEETPHGCFEPVVVDTLTGQRSRFTAEDA